jgi:thymidylate synthase
MEKKESDSIQSGLRGYGTIPIISIESENLAEAVHETIIACHDRGCRIETPKQKQGMTLGYDADITVKIKNPDSDPKVYFPGVHDDARGVMQYILEVTHGIHNHWKKCQEHPEWWGYTYNERFVDQLPFIFQRIKKDWTEKIGEWGNGRGRPSGRDYQFTTWRAGEDIILEQDDPPCLQRGQIRLLLNKEGDMVLNYSTDWRSRDLLKAWNENIIGQIELMKLFKDKISDMLQTPIKLGPYIDHCSSLHLYGLYIDRDGLEQKIEQMKKDGYNAKSMGLNDFFVSISGKDAKKLKGVVAAQMCAEYLGHGLNQAESTLQELGYNTDNFAYPKEWDTWPKSWDAEPDIAKLARVL